MISVTFYERDGAVIARPNVSRLDALVAPEFRTLMMSRTVHRSLLILSLEEVFFIDSSGLGTLVSILKNLGAGGRLYLAGVHNGVRALLRITRLDRVFTVFPNIEEALRG